MVKVRAAIFDMDGTLVDNMRFHVRAWVDVVSQLGLKVTSRERFEHEFNGRKNEEIVPRLLSRMPTEAELAEIAHLKESRYRELFRPNLSPLAGLDTLLQRLKAAGRLLAVATAAPEPNRALVLDGLALRGHFQVVVGAEDAPRGKPAPDIFLAAAERLGIEPAEAVVFEDAVNGVVAARSAGMRAVGVTTTASADELSEAGAEHVLADFTALPEPLERLLFA